MALIAERWGLIPALRDFSQAGRPVWGTCAGLIFLADRALGELAEDMHHQCTHWYYRSTLAGNAVTIARALKRVSMIMAGQKAGGQALLGGLDCLVSRNFFGAQINSFETSLPAPKTFPVCGPVSGPFRAMFIRAPAVLECGPGVEV